jgi:AraC-like DNA-binding protein
MNDTVGTAARDDRESAESFSNVGSGNEAPPNERGGRGLRAWTGADPSGEDWLPGESQDRPAPPAFRRIGAVSGLRLLLQEHGQECRASVSAAGLQPWALDRPQDFVRVSALGELLARVADITGCPHLGISLGARASVESLGIVGLLMRSCDTLGEAIRALEAHLHILDRGTLIHLEKADDAVVLACLQYGAAGRGSGIIAECLLATVVSVLRELCGADWAPSEVLLARRAPEDTNAFRSFFRAPVRFNQEMTTLVFPASFLSVRVSSADAGSRAILEREVRELDRTARKDLVDQVRRSLRKRLASGSCSCDELSRRFSVHRRTMNRHLKAAGTGFRTVLDELRFEVARQLVSDTELPLAQISAALNFSEPAAFTRAFERWSGGISPHRWRRLDHADGLRALRGRADRACA